MQNSKLQFKIKNFKLLTQLLIFNFVLLTCASGANASSLALSVSPPLLEVILAPGKSITKAYEVVNDSDSDIYLRTRVVPFEPAGSEGGVTLKLGNEPTVEPIFEKNGLQISLSNANLKLGETFLLKAGERRQLVLKVRAVAGSADKDYYLTLLAEQSSQGEFAGTSGSQPRLLTPGTGGQASGKIGSNLLITISGSGQPKQVGTIAEFSAQPRVADIFDKVSLNLIIANVDKNFFKPIGKIEIFQGKEKKLAELALRPDNVLSGSSRRIGCWLDESEIPCQFKAFWPGRYRALVTFSPDLAPAETQAGEVYFWLLPIKLMAGLLLAGVIVVLTIKKLGH